MLIAITSAVNYFVGHLCVTKGKKENSPILIASGAHLKSDTYSTLGLLLGLGLIMITGFAWIDSLTAVIFAFIIIYTGYKIIRKSLSGMMDETDEEIIADIIKVLNDNRKNDCIDVHNMRVINYAGNYHIDCHLTVPFYINVNQAHDILDTLTDLLKKHFDNRVEFFIHVDGCLFTQCTICNVQNCEVRQEKFVHQIEWTQENILSNNKHILNNEK
jgi:cation diffusion facilitator family transporter